MENKLPACRCTSGEDCNGDCLIPKWVAERVLHIRDALVVGDIDEAYHWLYQIASPEFNKISDQVWQDLEERTGYVKTASPPTPAIEGKEEDEVHADGIPLRQQWKETWDKVLAWHTDPVKMDWLKKNGNGIPHPSGRDIISPTPPAGAEGEGEIKKAPRQIKPRHITERELSAAQAKIAELEQTIREQKEWINSHL